MTDENKEKISNKSCWIKTKPIGLILFIFIFIFIFNNNVFAYNNLDYEKAYFKNLNIKEDRIIGTPIKINNRNLLFIGESYNHILDTETYEIKNLKQQIENVYVYSPVLLNNGEILFVGTYTTPPSDKFQQEIYDTIFRNQYNARRKIKEYKQLSEDEREKFYLPYFKNNNNFLKNYQEYKQKYEESMYSILYNPKTNKYKKVGKINERRHKPKTLLLNNGNVLVWGGSILGNNSIEIYNPSIEKYIQIKGKNWNNNTKAILMNDGRVFISNGEIYNPKDNTFTKLSEMNWQDSILLDNGNIYDYSTGKIYNSKTNSITNIKMLKNNCYIKIPENRILYCKVPSDINIYDIEQQKTININNLASIRSCYMSNMLLLNNNEVLIYNGEVSKYNKEYGTLKSILYAEGIRVQNKLQLLNLETGKIKIMKNKAPNYLMTNPVLLNDGKIIFHINGNNKYIILIPKIID